MIQIGDIVQINYDLPNSPLKCGMLGVIVHQHSKSAYELEPVSDSVLDETFAVTEKQITVVWSIVKKQWLPERKIAMETAWHLAEKESKTFSEHLILGWQNAKNIRAYKKMQQKMVA